MTSSRGSSRTGVNVLIAAFGFAGSLALVTSAQASPFVAPVQAAPDTAISHVQYWGGHGDWGHHPHRHEDRHYGYHRQHDGWGHRDHDWGHHRGWERRHHRHHHHHGHDRYDY